MDAREKVLQCENQQVRRLRENGLNADQICEQQPHLAEAVRRVFELGPGSGVNPPIDVALDIGAYAARYDDQISASNEHRFDVTGAKEVSLADELARLEAERGQSKRA